MRLAALLLMLAMATTATAQTTTSSTLPNVECPAGCIEGIPSTPTAHLGFARPSHCQCRGDVPLNETLDGIDRDLWEKGVSLSRFGAVCDGITPIDDAITAAYAAAPPGGIILIPPGTGPCVYGNTLPNVARVTLRGLSPIASWLKYTGNGYAVTMATSSDGWQRFERFTLEITAAALGGFKMVEQNRYNRFTDVEVVGGSTLAGIAYDLEGESSCNCFNTWEGCVVHNLATGWLFSGFANANHIEQSSCYTAGTCLAFQKAGTDTQGGQNNLIERFEVDGSTGLGVRLRDDADNNTFIKLVEDNASNSLDVGAGVDGTICIGCMLGNNPIGANVASVIFLGSAYTGNDALVDRSRIFGGLLLNDPNAAVALTLQRTTPFSLTDGGGLWEAKPDSQAAGTGITWRENGQIAIGDDAVNNGTGVKLGLKGVVQFQKTDTPGVTCAAGTEGGEYFDASLHKKCACNGTNWVPVDGVGGTPSPTSCG